MSKFKKGDRVIVIKGDRKGIKGTVINPRHGVISASDWPMVEVLIDHDGAPGAVRGFIYEDDRDLELADDLFEYAMQVIYGQTPRTVDAWTDKGTAMDRLKLRGHSGIDPIWGTWVAKLVKRKKAGPIVDA